MKSLMYRSPVFYILTLRLIHRRGLQRRYREISKIAKGKSVFEVGCGPGILGRYIGKERYSGMDINGRFVRYARRRGYDCRIGDIFKDKYPDADVGVAVDVLHHITPRERELIERLKKHFETVIVVEPLNAFNIPLPRFLRKIWDSFLGDADGINPLKNREKWQFTEEELLDYLKEMGAEKAYVIGKDVVAIFRGPGDNLR